MSLFKLPLRLFGLKTSPAVPFDIAGTADTLLRLDIRGHETQQALQGLTNEYTTAADRRGSGRRPGEALETRFS